MEKLFIFIVSLCSLCAENVSNDPPELWRDGKITPEQPFKGKVIAAGGLSPWSGDTAIYLKEDLGKERYLELLIGHGTGRGIRYREITKGELDPILKAMKFYGATVFIDPVNVSEFVWSSPTGYAGKKFGNEDIVRITYLASFDKAPTKPSKEPTPEDRIASDGKLLRDTIRAFHSNRENMLRAGLRLDFTDGTGELSELDLLMIKEGLPDRVRFLHAERMLKNESNRLFQVEMNMIRTSSGYSHLERRLPIERKRVDEALAKVREVLTRLLYVPPREF